MAISEPKTSQHKLAQMPSKLRKAIGAVKDQTSIGLAKVSGGADTVNVEISVLKATTHDDAPVDTRHADDILAAIAANRSFAAASAQAIARRVGKTRNWIVALKSLLLVLRILQEGDHHFPREFRKAMRTGAKILNLSNFRDDSNSRPWDCTSFVRAFALYLDERLDCLLSGRLHRLRRAGAGTEPVHDMKPTTLIDRISHWQKLLDRAIGANPAGEAQKNRLVQAALQAVVRESFELYRDVSDGLALLLDSFFHLQYQSCVNSFQACVRASKQFEELGEFYGRCKAMGIGRTSEYPSVQKVSGELIETLQEFLKDRASFPARPPADRVEAEVGTSTSSEPNSASTDEDEPGSSKPASGLVSPESGENLDGWDGATELTEITELTVLAEAGHLEIESDGQGSFTLESRFAQANTWSNPFLPEGGVGPSIDGDGVGDVAPTFCARDPSGNGKVVGPFESFWGGEEGSYDGVMTEVTERERQLWLENQKKIIAKRINGLMTFD